MPSRHGGPRLPTPGRPVAALRSATAMRRPQEQSDTVILELTSISPVLCACHGAAGGTARRALGLMPVVTSLLAFFSDIACSGIRPAHPSPVAVTAGDAGPRAVRREPCVRVLQHLAQSIALHAWGRRAGCAARLPGGPSLRCFTSTANRTVATAADWPRLTTGHCC